MATLANTLGESSANLAADNKNAADQNADARKNFNYPLVKYSDMPDEIRGETVDMVVTAIEKHPGNYEAASKNVKEVMDKKFGSSWHVVIGEGFAFDITHEMRNLLFMYFGGTIAALVWKAST